MPGSITAPLYASIRVSVYVSHAYGRKAASLTITVQPGGATLLDVAQLIQDALSRRFKTTSLDDGRHKRR